MLVDAEEGTFSLSSRRKQIFFLMSVPFLVTGSFLPFIYIYIMDLQNKLSYQKKMLICAQKCSQSAKKSIENATITFQKWSENFKTCNSARAAFCNLNYLVSNKTKNYGRKSASSYFMHDMDCQCSTERLMRWLFLRSVDSKSNYATFQGNDFVPFSAIKCKNQTFDRF